MPLAPAVPSALSWSSPEPGKCCSPGLRAFPWRSSDVFWGGFFASTWIPAYAQLKDSVPSQVVATAMGILNLFFWLGGAVYQQVSGLIVAGFPALNGQTPLAAYQGLFWLCLGSLGLSIILVAMTTEHPASPLGRAQRKANAPSRAPGTTRVPRGASGS